MDIWSELRATVRSYYSLFDSLRSIIKSDDTKHFED